MEELCNICGKPTNLDEFEPSLVIPRIMRSCGLCFSCALWTRRMILYEESKDVIPIIVSGTHYSLDKSHAVIGISSNNGLNWTQLPNMQRILMFDGTLYATNNLWYQGKIPQHFLKDKRLQDNAMFLTPSLYLELSQLREVIQTGHVPAEIIKKLLENNQ